MPNPCTICHRDYGCSCNHDNPCYEDCGCLNPNTFNCITLPGTLPAIGVTNNMNGLQVLAAINNTINTLVLGTNPSQDKYVRASITDTTSGYLANKLLSGLYLKTTLLNAGSNEQLLLDANLPAMISGDEGNLLEIGTDNKMRVIFTPPAPDFGVVGGSGVTVTGTGVSSDPFVVSTNPSISALRNCFTGTWSNITLASLSNAYVTYVSGTPQYRIRFDGTIEFRGSATYTVAFSNYSGGQRTVTLTVASIPSTCVTLSELAGVSDLKAINYIDAPQASADQIVQQFGYIIRKSTQNIILSFQSSFTNATTKTIVVNFEGAISYPVLS